MKNVFVRIIVILIGVYQRILSPDRGLFRVFFAQGVCGFTPNCSQYAREVFEKHWFILWFKFSMSRIGKCRGWCEHKADPSSFKVVFFSSAPIWVPFLEKISQDSRLQLVWVVTGQDKAVGRGQQVKPNIIKKFVKDNISECCSFVVTPSNINPEKSQEWKDFHEWLLAKSPDFIVVIAYGKIIDKSILDIPSIWPINIHWSILPKYRGASPIQSVLLHWDTHTWISIMHMNAKMDEWNVYKILKFEIEREWTSTNIINKMCEEWPQFCTDTLWDIWKGDLVDKPQDHNIALYCKKIQKEDWKIDWSQTNEQIYNQYRAYSMWPKVYTFFKWKKLDITKCTLHSQINSNAKIWEVVMIDYHICVVCGKGVLLLQSVKIEWKKEQPVKDFVNWYRDFVWTIFS